MAELLTIGEVAREAGLPIDTIRWYERTGVLPQPPRRASGYRAYTRAHLETVRFAAALRELGLPPRQIAALVAVFHEGSCADLQAALAATTGEALARIEARLAALAAAAERLRALGDAIRGVSPTTDCGGPLSPCDCARIIEMGPPGPQSPAKRRRPAAKGGTT
ncbi:MerR family transcriptional regulator [Tepidiforma sp.]|uniref:MerR family transcriptional regulator n=1 Tax=Tepidiforma sp. TaxID=2682230 RepID=UPI002ADDCE5D|nr:MerR family transcriptional regulator [Tepidiforma sp.]